MIISLILINVFQETKGWAQNREILLQTELQSHNNKGEVIIHKSYDF